MKLDVFKRSRSRRPVYSTRVADEDGKEHYERLCVSCRKRGPIAQVVQRVRRRKEGPDERPEKTAEGVAN